MKLAIGKLEQCSSYVRTLPIKISDFLDYVNFMVAPLQEHGIVLETDWLFVNNIFIQCPKHQVILQDKTSCLLYLLRNKWYITQRIIIDCNTNEKINKERSLRGPIVCI